MNKRPFIFLSAASILCASLLSSGAARAGVDWLHFFFPMIKTGKEEPDPSKTLIAPFAEQATAGPHQVGPTDQTGLPENATPLAFAHKNSKQVGEWVMGAVSQALTFDKPDYHDSLNEILKNFSEDGKKQYLQFLQDNKIISILDSKKYDVRGFAPETPTLLNEGAIDGKYRWLFETSLMVSYMDHGAKDYKDSAPPVNQSMTVTVQVGRTMDLTSGKDILIESWAAKAQSLTTTGK